MPLNLASPGIVVREVDLTVGRVDTASDKVGALVGCSWAPVHSRKQNRRGGTCA
mgnify:CR=1 FL=1